MTRAVLDSTILVSAFLVRGGPANELLRHAEAGAFVVSLCPAILQETSRVLLDYPRIRKRYHYTDEVASQYVQLLGIVAEISTDLPHVRGAVRDPDDDVIIACALKAEADYIVTRDKDLLSLGSYKEIAIIRPEEFLELLRTQSSQS